MQLFDRATIVEKRRTRDGYLAVNARVARAGNVQQYSGSEVGRPHLSIVNVFRPEEEVFNKDTLASFMHRPVTLGHPSSMVTADNWAAVAKGWSDGEVARDGEFIRLSMLLADSAIIQAIDGGTRQISMGYDCELEWTPGISPAGERYDAKQTRIRGNHVAIVEAARGGPELRIGDSAMPTSVIDERTGFVDQAFIDAEAAKPEYDWCRHMMSRSGFPSLAQEYAMRNLLAASPAGQRAEAAYDHHVHKLSTAHAEHTGAAAQTQTPTPQFAKDGRPFASLNDAERARETMMHQMGEAWKRGVDDMNAWRK